MAQHYDYTTVYVEQPNLQQVLNDHAVFGWWLKQAILLSDGGFILILERSI